ncbi:MAG: hypothetical protein WB681_04965, partial [Candidatus Cybelea sp.]
VILVLAGCSSGGNGAQLAPSGPTQQTRRVRPNTEQSWSYYNYNPNEKTLSRKQAAVLGGTATFNFAPGVFTALLTTMDKPLTGNLTGETLTDTVAVGPTSGTFVTQNGGGCNNPPAVRFYFDVSGKFAYTNFWWSNPESFVLASNGTATLAAPLTDPSQWSDWNGQSGSSDPADFNAAVANVKSVGLSFGGDCFFENRCNGRSRDVLQQHVHRRPVAKPVAKTERATLLRRVALSRMTSSMRVVY